MWNPFSRVTLAAVTPSQDVKPADGPEKSDPFFKAQMEQAQLRTLLAHTEITMIHDALASRALHHLRGGSK